MNVFIISTAYNRKLSLNLFCTNETNAILGFTKLDSI